MAGRSRYRELQYVNGPNAVMPNAGGVSVINGYHGFTGEEQCIDTTMPKPYNADHDLRILKRIVKRQNAFNGTFNYFNNGQSFYDVNMNGHIGPLYAHPSFLPNPPEPVWAYWETKALANLNPGKSNTGVPLFLFEFKDFPEMLHHAGRVLTRHARASDYPGSYLAYHFGWAPLVNDFNSLFNLAKQVADRADYFSRLERGSQVRRTLFNRLVDTSVSPTSYTSIPRSPGWIYEANVEAKTYVKVWYTANAKLAPGVSLPKSPRGLNAQAFRAVSGLSGNPAELWDFLPWTWLADYFVNIGDFMQANIGLMSLMVTRMNVMHRTKIIVGHTNPRTVDGVFASGYEAEVTDKRRKFYVNPIPWLAARPFLGFRQIFALENLVTAKAFKAAAGH